MRDKRDGTDTDIEFEVVLNGTGGIAALIRNSKLNAIIIVIPLVIVVRAQEASTGSSFSHQITNENPRLKYSMILSYESYETLSHISPSQH